MTVLCSTHTDAKDFINDDRLAGWLDRARPDKQRVRELLAKSLAKEPLDPEETAVLLAASDPDSILVDVGAGEPVNP